MFMSFGCTRKLYFKVHKIDKTTACNYYNRIITNLIHLTVNRTGYFLTSKKLNF